MDCFASLAMTKIERISAHAFIAVCESARDRRRSENDEGGSKIVMNYEL